MQCLNRSNKEISKMIDAFGEVQTSKLLDNFSENVIPTFEQVKSLYDSSPEIGFNLKAIDILYSDKGIEVFNKGQKNNWSLDKILTELSIPKEQKKLIFDSGKTDREDIITDLLANYSYTIEVNTAIKNKSNISQTFGKPYQLLKNEFPNTWYVDTGTGPVDFLTEVEALEYIARNNKKENTSHYSNLTVPGGTNGSYIEANIETPMIVPSIQSHAQFKTDNTIGWMRADEKQNYQEKDIDNLIEIMKKSGILEVNCG